MLTETIIMSNFFNSIVNSQKKHSLLIPMYQNPSDLMISWSFKFFLFLYNMNNISNGTPNIQVHIIGTPKNTTNLKWLSL
jgi:hypothetical protein